MCMAPDVSFWHNTFGEPEQVGWYFGMGIEGPKSGPFPTFDDAIEAYQKTLGG